MNTKGKIYLNNFNKEEGLLPACSGFISFFDSKTNEYFFRFNSKSGEPILYSEAFDKAEKRDARILLLIKNAHLKKRYKLEKEGRQYYIIFRAGNHQEIARSKKYKSESKAKKIVDYLMKHLAETTGNNLIAESKYSFRIDLYPREGEPLAGVVTNVINEEDEKFRGLDAPLLIDFIKSQLNEADRKQEVLLAPQEAETPLLHAKENLVIELVNNEYADGRKNWGVNTSFDIRLKLMKGVKLPEDRKVKMKILLNSIQNHIVQNQLITEVEFSKDNIAYLEGMQSVNHVGIYRLKAIAAQNDFFGTTAFNVF